MRKCLMTAAILRAPTCFVQVSPDRESDIRRRRRRASSSESDCILEDLVVPARPAVKRLSRNCLTLNVSTKMLCPLEPTAALYQARWVALLCRKSVIIDTESADFRGAGALEHHLMRFM